MLSSFIAASIDKGLLPDAAIRFAIRSLLKRRLGSLSFKDDLDQRQYLDSFICKMKESPLAIQTDKANEQHYEVPASFYELVLGPNLKYSSALWNGANGTLGTAEDAMLQLYAERAEIRDGQSILELGCGWGSLSLWLARKYPNSTITALSNSNSQREYIITCAEKRGLSNIKLHTCDINNFESTERFDRIVSIEMFEHLRNWELLFRRIDDWLHPAGKLFFHIFTARRAPYLFEAHSSLDWMARYFFSGGMMPSDNLPLEFQSHLKCERKWEVSGTHYAKTAAAWLDNLDRNWNSIALDFEARFGKVMAETLMRRWRVFFMACEELFGFAGGNEWHVMHYLFSKRAQ